MADTYQFQEGARSAQGASGTVNDTSAKVIGSGSSVAALCGLGAIVLAILGLAGMAPVELCAVAVLAAGAGLVFQGGAIAARYRDVQAAAADHRGEVEIEGGMTAEMVGGVAGIVLGILALIHIASLTLLPVAAIVLGATLLLGSGATYQAAEIPTSDHQSEYARHATHRAASSAAGAEILIGLGGVTLGILGLIGVAGHGTPVLSLVALLCVGVAGLLSGSVLGARMGSMFHHHHHH